MPIPLNEPGPQCVDDAHRLRLMHMLLRDGEKVGYGKGRLAGYVFHAFDGKLYVTSCTDIRTYDYFEAMRQLRDADEIDTYDRH